jgi:universal stress protein A
MTFDISRILVPLDFSTNSRRALDYAYGLARKFDAALHLVHVCEVPSVMVASLDGYAIAYNEWTESVGEQAGRQLATIAESLGDVKVTTEVLFGGAPSAILTAAATNQSDLIVMGTHGHGAVMHLLMGNVAERVVRMAPCPVVTVREPQAKEQTPMPKAHTAGVVTAIVAACAMLAPGLAAAL